MGGYARSKIFMGSSLFRFVFPKGQPLVSHLATFATYFVFPGAMFASLYYCPEDHPDRKNKKKRQTVSSST